MNGISLAIKAKVHPSSVKEELDELLKNLTSIKDKRSKFFEEAKDGELATEKQKNYLKDLGVEFDDSITKKEASGMIEQSKNC